MLAVITRVCVIWVFLFAGTFGVFFAGSIFSVTVFADAIVGDFTGDVITRTGGNTFFEIIAVVGAGVDGFLAFGTECLGIAFLAAAFGIVEVIVIASGRYAAVIIIGIIASEFIARTTTSVGDEAGCREFYSITLALEGRGRPVKGG